MDPAGASRIGIVGASLAGLHAAMTLRRQGFTGEVVVYGDEPHAPYDRPPLSKEVARGEWQPERTALALDETLGIQWRLGCAAVSLDVEARTIELCGGGRERCGAGIVIATGARARTLPGCELDGVHVVRTLDDSVRLARDLAAGPRRVGIVGAGFIGAEVASACRALGLEVTLLEALPVPMERVLGAELGDRIAAIHRAHGVDVRLGVTVTRFVADERGRVRRLQLSNGTVLEVDVVVVGVGAEPCVGWLAGSGLMVDDGLVCDETCLAAPGVVAAGDVARWPNRRFDEVRRVEHWDNAIRQAEHAARRLLAPDGSADAAVPYAPIPWFWSDQYDLKLQLVGTTEGHDEMMILSGRAEQGRLLALYRRRDRLVCAFAIGGARAIVECRRQIERGVSWSDAVAELSSALPRPRRPRATAR